ncbi:UNVERIFIED_CONTAM: AP2-like ethylene-responsive transcription factor BBM2 [Sesamum indicum]
MNNNWLGFSLSPQEQLPQENSSSLPTLDQISAAAAAQVVSSQSCFNHLTTATAPSHHSGLPLPSLNLPPPFSLFQPFNTSNLNTTSQDWTSIKDVSINSFSCSSHSHSLENQETPKLENFLGVGGQTSFAHDHHHQHHKKLCLDHIASNSDTNYDTSNFNIYQETEPTSHHTNTTTTNSTIGLSMIKNWLRSNPGPPDNKGGADEAVAPPPLAGPTSAGAQTLSLSMNTNGNAMESCASDSKLADSQAAGGGAVESVPRKSIDTFGQRTSIYRGVTRHRWTGRYEAHLWDNSCRREGQTRKGRQGGYDKEEKAARAYDLAALKYWGTTTTTNFPISNYEKELEEMKHMTRQEYVASLRRKSSGFSRGASIYRGVTRHHQHGRWQARIGRVAGNKDLYLGTFSTQEEAAEAYDIAAIKFRGLNAVTNFEINRYDVKSILESSTLPIGGAAKRLKDAENAETALEMHRANEGNLSLHLTDGHINNYGSGGNNHSWPTIAFQQSQPLNMYPYAHQRLWCKQEQDHDFSHGLNDIHHQLQLGNTQNFLQPSVLHNLMSLDSSSMEHSSGSNSVVYGNNNGDGSGNGSYGNGANGSGFMVPMMGTVIVQDGSQNQGNGFLGNEGEKAVGYEGNFGSSDAYQQARNLYYQSQQSSSDGIGSTCNNWIPTAVPTQLAARNSNLAVCHGASNFTVWNDT